MPVHEAVCHSIRSNHYLNKQVPRFNSQIPSHIKRREHSCIASSTFSSEPLLQALVHVLNSDLQWSILDPQNLSSFLPRIDVGRLVVLWSRARSTNWKIGRWRWKSVEDIDCERESGEWSSVLMSSTYRGVKRNAPMSCPLNGPLEIINLSPPA
jgi:hypothetical protein